MLNNVVVCICFIYGVRTCGVVCVVYNVVVYIRFIYGVRTCVGQCVVTMWLCICGEFVMYMKCTAKLKRAETDMNPGIAVEAQNGTELRFGCQGPLIQSSQWVQLKYPTYLPI